jgi:hypothetical protein
MCMEMERSLPLLRSGERPIQHFDGGGRRRCHHGGREDQRLQGK